MTRGERSLVAGWESDCDDAGKRQAVIQVMNLTSRQTTDQTEFMERALSSAVVSASQVCELQELDGWMGCRCAV